MKEVTGDLIKLGLEGKFDVIIHGCNCFHTMGAGIAAQIKRKIPNALKADKATKYGSKEKLGDYSSAIVNTDHGKLVVVNGYTQFSTTMKVDVDYEAVASVFNKIKNDFPGLRIGYPKIGAGLAGGDWGIISKSIEEALVGEDHTLVIFGR